MLASEREPYSVEELCERLAEGWAARYVFFWSHRAKGRTVGRECFSQWYPATFTLDALRFRSAEHYMMYRKSRLFGDQHTAELILGADHPREAKRLGRTVRGFDEDVWKEKRFAIVVAGSVAKFGQNHELGSFLLGTAPRVLVEASPQDRIWGIGLAEKDRDARQPERWRGSNLLGFALMKARAELAARNLVK